MIAMVKTTRSTPVFAPASLALLLVLTACGSDKDAELEKIDQQLTAKKNTDPAVNEALEGQIMVDPSLSSQSNEHSVRPANQPNAGALPLADGARSTSNPGQTLGGIAEEQARIAQENFVGCQLDVSYSMDFAAKAPADLPLFPKGRVTEAAGSDTANCKLRAISYVAPSATAELVSYYGGIAKAAGYSFGDKMAGENHIVTGKRAADGAAFYAILTPAGTETSVDLVANNGR
jgi:hypothetical protein